MSMKSLLQWGLAIVCGLLLASSDVHAQMAFQPRPANGLALTPPMGWNSWNKFGCNISEATLRAQADALVSTGMRDAGYVYLVVDDCWHGARDAHGDIQPDPVRFPSGIKALADYVHGKGLKFGIYSDAGAGTCQDKPGSRGHEFQDAAQYARWGADYLKYDWCNAEDLNARSSYATMSDAIRATGRPMVLSICEWGLHQPAKWGAAVGGNLWRTTFDIWDHWSGRGNKGLWLGVTDIIDLQPGLESAAGPGHWNDPDMLEVGNGGMSDTEYRSHFALWAMLAAPLIAGNDLTQMSRETLAILTAPEIIAIDQDKLGVQGRRVVKSDGQEVWIRPLSDGATAVLFLNRAETAVKMDQDLVLLGFPANGEWKVRDAWRRKNMPRVKSKLSVQVPAHGTQVFVLKSI